MDDVKYLEVQRAAQKAFGRFTKIVALLEAPTVPEGTYRTAALILRHPRIGGASESFSCHRVMLPTNGAKPYFDSGHYKLPWVGALAQFQLSVNRELQRLEET